VAYDSARDRLYVADQGNDRVMVFDVAPDQFVNHPSAVAVLGQANTWSQSNQVLRDVSAQDQLYDPRGLAFDSVNQRLYATDSHWARLMVFTFPESHYAVSSPSHGVMGFSSLDPVLALRPSQRVSGYGIVREASSVLWKRTKSQVMMEAQTEQQSRMLISQTVARAAAPTTRALMFIDHRDGTRAMVAVINPTNVAQRVQFSFRQGSDSVSALRIIPPGERLTLDVSEAVGASVGAWLGIGALDVESEVPLSVVGWSVANTRHGDALVTVLPVVRGVPANPVTVLPNVTIGGGYRTDVILLNPHDESVQGEVSVRDETGQEIERERYLLEPRSSFVWRPSGDGLIVRTRYVVVYPHSPSTPSVAALVSRWEEGLITMGAIEPVSSILQARVPVDTMPDLIRHGRRTQFHLVIANASDHGASVRLILRDLDGKEIDRVERLILAGAQTDFTLGELFDRVQFSGSLSLGSDVPVAVTARQLTTNLRGDEILTEIPVLTDSAKEATQLFPYTDGAGDSTQVVVLAGPMALVDSSIDFLGVDGRPLDVILR